MHLDPYLISSIFISLLMLVTAIKSRGTLRVALLALLFLIGASFLFLVVPLGEPGFQVGCFLLFPFCLAFFGFAIGFRTHGIRKSASLTFAFALSVGTFVLDAFLLFREMIGDPEHVYALESFAKFAFLVAEVLILFAAVALAILVAFGLWFARLISKRKG